MKVIDFYAGIGGWSLGFRMAGLNVVRSYEWWDAAVKTHELNLGTPVVQTNIRLFSPLELPRNIKIIVGSPPCTEFSYSNRGGSGDIANGLIDIIKFLEIIAYLKPDFWAMENVPRMKGILDKELVPGGKLASFNSLGFRSEVIDMSEFGVPQRRKRCIAGNFDFDLLLSYRDNCPTRTLGQVITSLHGNPVVDPIYGSPLSESDIYDNEEEEPLNDEEVRCNQEWKSHHPVYNDMRFPDSLEEPARTITATCTRVSRESVIIRNGGGRFRRLSVRERGCLQSFPVTYQFHGKSHSQKLKMVGNAIPPLFTFFIAQAMLGTSPKSLLTPEKGIQSFIPPAIAADATKLDREGQTYPKTRRFWFAIPNLRFKSGFRFDLMNENPDTEYSDWVVSFWYGNSKNIKKLVLRSKIFHRVIARAALKSIRPELDSSLLEIEQWKAKLAPDELQAVWAHKGEGNHPFEILDKLGEIANFITKQMLELPSNTIEEIAISVIGVDPTDSDSKKIRRYAREVVAGILVGSKFNSALFRRIKSVKA